MTPTQALATDRLGRDVVGYVAELREGGSSWAAITRLLFSDTGLEISDETLRRWTGVAA